MVAVHERRLPSASGKAEIPGEGESMSCINSAWRLRQSSVLERSKRQKINHGNVEYEPFGHALGVVSLGG